MSLIICMVSELKKKDKILIKIMVYRLFCQHTLSFLCHMPQCHLGRPCMMMVMMMMLYGHDLLWCEANDMANKKPYPHWISFPQKLTKHRKQSKGLKTTCRLLQNKILGWEGPLTAQPKPDGHVFSPVWILGPTKPTVIITPNSLQRPTRVQLALWWYTVRAHHC